MNSDSDCYVTITVDHGSPSTVLPFLDKETQEIYQKHLKQECIPVECVLPAC